MGTISINIVLAIVWAAVTGNFSELNLLFGFAIGAIVLALIRAQIGAPTHVGKLYLSINLALTFLWELIKSSVNVAWIVLSPSRTLRPAIIAYPLSVTRDSEITLLANLITLTPGTLSMDVSEDRKTLYIHAIDAPDPDDVVNDIKESFEGRIMKVFAS